MLFDLMGSDARATSSRGATRRGRLLAALTRHRQKQPPQSILRGSHSVWAAWMNWTLERENAILRELEKLPDGNIGEAERTENERRDRYLGPV